MNNVSGNFFIEMLVDGDSAQGNIRSTKPLVQMYNPNTSTCRQSQIRNLYAVHRSVSESCHFHFLRFL